MARISNQKCKLLILKDIFERETDEAHPLSMAELIEKLRREGIEAERKSLYRDMDELRLYGLDIETTRDKTTRYYLASRLFELPELLLLADSVQSSRFITEKKTRQLTEKLKLLTSRYEGEHFSRRFHVVNRIKSMNESIYYNVDAIHEAIAADRQITFLYYEYGRDKKERLRRDGGRYEVSPFALTWDSENYYLIAFDSENAQIRHYRVDRMKGIQLSEKPREGHSCYERLDPDRYERSTFSMFNGEDTPVTMEFDGRLAGAVIDRFGKDILFIPCENGAFRINVPVSVSPPFFGWIFGFDGGARLIGPEWVVERYRQMLEKSRAL